MIFRVNKRLRIIVLELRNTYLISVEIAVCVQSELGVKLGL
jgi:hypothetical protein